jgi:hypothetical protein
MLALTLEDRLREEYVHRLIGWKDSMRSKEALIAYTVGLDPNFMNSLINKYGLARVRQAQLLPDSKVD